MSESLRDRLAAKSARRVVVPIQLSEPGQAQARVERAAQALNLVQLEHVKSSEAERAAAAQAAQDEVDAARAAVAEHYLEVELRAMHPDEWEALVAAHPAAKDSEDPWDWGKVLPAALAECATDESLRDGDWWAAELASGRWTWGDVQALRMAVLHVNTRTPDVLVPKG